MTPFTVLLKSDEVDLYTNLNTNIATEGRLSKCSGSAVHRNQLADGKVVCQLVQTREPIATKFLNRKQKSQEEMVKLNWEKLFLTTSNLSYSVQTGLSQQQVSNESHNLAAVKARNPEPLKKLQCHQTTARRVQFQSFLHTTCLQSTKLGTTKPQSDGFSHCMAERQ